MRLIPALVLALSTPAASAKDADERAALARASARGALLYAYDQAAWHGTDDMFAKLPQYQDKVAGYVVEGSRTSPRLIFFDKTRSMAVYAARLENGRLVDGHALAEDEDRSIAPTTRRMIEALVIARAAVALDADIRSCTAAPFNTVVLPPETPDGPILVYFLTPQTDTAHIPFGGHYRIEVDTAGHARQIRRFTNGCLNMPIAAPNAPAAKTQALFVTHLLDPVPTEIHVFTSLALRRAVFVGTTTPSDRVWPVTGDRIGPPQALEPSR